MAVLRFILAAALALSASGSPISKVLELLGGMEEKVKKEAVESDETMKEKAQFCERRASDLGYSIKTSQNEKEELEARISKAEGKSQSVGESIQEAMAGIESNKANLASATGLRSKEKAQFQAAQKDLMDTMESMKRAVAVLEKEAAKGTSASLLQVQKAPGVMAAIDAMVSGAMIGAADAEGLTAFLQNSEEASDLQVPAPAYQSKSGGIVEMLEDMQDKANSELSELRQKEETAQHSFEMLQQSLQSQIGFAEEEVSKLKAALAQAQSSKTSDQKDLQEAESNLEADKKELDDLIVECRRKKEDYKIEKKDLAEELEALGKAKEALAEKTGESYSFLQVGTSSHAGTARPDENIATMLRDVAQRTNSTGLSLLSRRIRSLIRSDLTSGADAFEKIKTMISDMISSMEEQIRKAADKKAYCDSELAKAKTKLEGKQDEVEDLQTKMDGAASKSATLKAEASELRKALAVLAETEANATALREKESAQFEKTVPEVQEGLEGVKTALKVLREYYQGTKAASNRGGTATGVVGMLEVVESDFAKNLAQLRVAEATAKEDFKKGMQDLKLEKTRKEQDVKYKTQAAQRLDADLTELQSDSESVHTELSAIEEFNNGLKAECSVTPESFQEKQAKRKEEIDGLKTALEALDSQSGASFMQSQKKAVLRWLRGSRRADLSHD